MPAHDITEVLTRFRPVFIGRWPRCNPDEPKQDFCEAAEAIARAHLDNGNLGLALLARDDDVIWCFIFDIQAIADEERFGQTTNAISEVLGIYFESNSDGSAALCAPVYIQDCGEVPAAIAFLWIDVDGDSTSIEIAPLTRDGFGQLSLGECVEITND
jgi:hypothetical protein